MVLKDKKIEWRVNKMSFLSTVWPILLLFVVCILLIIVKIVRMIRISRDKLSVIKVIIYSWVWLLVCL